MKLKYSTLYGIQVHRTNYIKIGVTKHNPRKRLRTLQTCTPLELLLMIEIPVHPVHAYGIEKYIHAHLFRYRVRHEWFEIDLNTCITLLEQLVANYPYPTPPIDRPISYASDA